MKTTTWKDVTGTVSIELYRFAGMVWDASDDTEAPVCLLPHVLDCEELVVEFTSSGFSQPMSMYGGPDHLGWPAEMEDERLLARVYFYDGSKPAGQREHPLPDDVAAELFEHYRDRIEAAELNPIDD